MLHRCRNLQAARIARWLAIRSLAPLPTNLSHCSRQARHQGHRPEEDCRCRLQHRQGPGLQRERMGWLAAWGGQTACRMEGVCGEACVRMHLGGFLLRASCARLASPPAQRTSRPAIAAGGARAGVRQRRRPEQGRHQDDRRPRCVLAGESHTSLHWLNVTGHRLLVARDRRASGAMFTATRLACTLLGAPTGAPIPLQPGVCMPSRARCRTSSAMA